MRANESRRPEIETQIERCGLRFIGFDFDDGAITAKFCERYTDSEMGDLERWCEFDQTYPDLMEGYVFWGHKV